MFVLRIALLLFGALFASSAQAQSVQTAYAGGSPVVLNIPVTASIGGRCGFADAAAPSGTVNKTNFDREGLSAQFDFSLNCTGPARVAITSANRGLVTSAAADAGYANKADYQVTLRLLANDGGSVEATCAASALSSGAGCAFGGAASTSEGLRLGSASVNQPGSYVKISAAPRTGTTVLVAGTYTDSLTITVSPSI